ncbi:MAG: hypothetical protein H6993_00325 [Pseudomonadales bacterium]|nr:hypothetical protein [Pseudomonadales bacterium]MCP5182368.1 hypothetical protein [Pseudomonadales bacterium]
MKLLGAGTWEGRGSVLFEGRSLGLTTTSDMQVEVEDGALLLTGHVDVVGHGSAELSARLVENEHGTYTLDVFHRGARLDGMGKFDSEPNLGLLWNEAGTIHVSVALFATGRGVGCRGFLRERGAGLTWEIAFTRQGGKASGGNVVSMFRRKGR